MKKFLMFSILMCLIILVNAQPPDVPAEKGANFGEKVDPNYKPVTPQQLQIIIKNKADKKADVQLKATVVEVCSKEGCWIKVVGTNGNMLVKMKDHKFLVPLVLNGKEVLIDGTAQEKVTSVEMLKHYAEDAGKSKEEIDAIKEPKVEIVIQAKGILVL